jgi:hypothetical protein
MGVNARVSIYQSLPNNWWQAGIPAYKLALYQR